VVKNTEELSAILKVYNEATRRLQLSHDLLTQEVARLSRELKQKNRLLARKTRLEVLGEMAAGVAHEIRNPLGGIELYASLLERDLSNSPEQLRLVGRILTGVHSLDAIVGDLLSFTRGFEPSPQPCLLSAVVEDALAAAVADFARTEIRVRREFCDPDVALKADPELLRRAFLNIILNAIQAMKDTGELTVRTESGGADIPVRGADIPVCDEGQTRMSAPPGRCWVEFGDTGPGISSAMQDRLFEPYATDKQGGTGLGLAIVQKIVESHGGVVSARNIEGGGACFKVELTTCNLQLATCK
jgi:signal transduction histidine kinase